MAGEGMYGRAWKGERLEEGKLVRERDVAWASRKQGWREGKGGIRLRVAHAW